MPKSLIITITADDENWLNNALKPLLISAIDNLLSDIDDQCFTGCCDDVSVTTKIQ